MLKKIFIPIWILMIIITIIIALNTRNSYISSNIKDYDTDKFSCTGDSLEIDNKKNTTDYIKKLDKTSEVIVKVNPINIENKNLGIQAISKVKKVFKGDNKLENTNIRIYDSGYFNFKHKTYMAVGCSSMIDIDKEYILFLKKVNVRNEDIYYLNTKSVLSKFSTKVSNIEIKPFEDQNDEFYHYKNFDIITMEKEDILFYKELKKEVLNKY